MFDLSNMFPLFFCGRNALKSPAKEAAFRNTMEWYNQLSYYINICLSQFEWELPGTINPLYLEQALLFEGKVGVANDPDYGIIALRCAPSDVYNIYGDYAQLTLYGNSYPSKTFNAYMAGADNSLANAVLGRDNSCMYPYFNNVVMLADRLSDAMRSIDVSMYLSCFPFIIGCDESEKKSFEDAVNKIRKKQLAIIGTKMFNAESFKLANTGFNPSILAAQWDSYNKMENQGRQMLGIQSNNQPDKSERLIVDEVNSNNQITHMSIGFRLRERELLCERCNEIFGTSMSVKLREGYTDLEVEYNDNDPENTEPVGE